MARALELDHYIGHLIRRAEQVHTTLWSQHVSREITSQQLAVLNALSRDPGIGQRTLLTLTDEGVELLRRIAVLDDETSTRQA